MSLFAAQEADSGCEAAALAGAEGGLRVGRVDDAVDYEGIAAAGDVVEAAAEGEVVSEEVKAFFELQVEREIIGEALGTGRADELLLVVEKAEGESGAGFEGVGDFELMNDGQLEEGQVSPGEEAVGSVPGKGAGLLRAEDGAVDVEIESLIGAGTRAGVGAHERVIFTEVVTEGELEGGVVIVARVLEEVVGGVGGGVVDEAAGAALFEELGFKVNRGGKFLFEAEAPVEEAWDLERARVDGEGGGDRASRGDAGRKTVGIDREERVLASAGVGAGDEEDGRGI